MLTGLYAALCALLVFALSLRIALLRKRLRIGIGDGGDAGLAAPSARRPTPSSTCRCCW